MQDWPVSADKGMHEMSSRAKYLSIRAPLLVTQESVESIGVSSRNGHFCTLRESSVHEINNFQATCKARSLSRSHTGKLIVFNAIHRLSYDFFHFVSRPRIAKRNAARLRGGKGSLRALRDHLALVFRYGCQNANLDQCCVACTN